MTTQDPHAGEILNMISAPNITPGRTENDDLFVTEDGDFICFATTLHHWHTVSVHMRRHLWLR